MAGLLGDGFDDPRSAAIMALSGGLLQGNFGAGLMGAQQAYQGANDGLLKRKMLEAQISETQAQAQERAMNVRKHQAAMEQAARIQAGIPGLFRQPGLTGGEPQPQMEGGVPMFSKPMGAGPMQATPGGFDVQKAIALGMDPKMIGEYAGLQNIGRQKVARTVKGMGPDGREFEYQVDEFGQKVGDGMAQYRAPISVNQGDRTTFADPYSLKPVGQFQTNQSMDSRASNATAMRGQNMTDARAREFNAVQQDANNIKRTEKKDTADLTKNSQIASFDTMLGTLDRLKVHPGLSRSVGAVGMLPTMPGSNSANFQAELNTFQSQAFLPMVAQLKGMGALSDAEGKKLTAAVGALDPKMGEQAFRDSVDRITADMEAARQRMAGKPRSGAGSNPPAPMKGMVKDGYKFKGGNPADPSSWERQ